MKPLKEKAKDKNKDTLIEKLIKSKAVDLRDNSIIEDLGNGYSRIIPIDKTKIFIKDSAPL